MSIPMFAFKSSSIHGRDETIEPLLEEDASSTTLLSGDYRNTRPAAHDDDDFSSEKAGSIRWHPIDSHSFIPAFEGLRGIAVVFAHFNHILAKPELMRDVIGSTGVSIFFVLSGFLITGVLMRSQEKNKGASTYSHLPRFYMDRAVRLTPALLLVVVVMSPLFVWQGLKVSYVVRYALMAIFYLSNIDSLFAWHDEAGCFSNTWSLACEEHFYIVWSLLLPFICKMKPRWQHATLLFLIATSLNVRIITSMYPGTFFGIHYYRNSFNNFWKMLLGASLRIIPIPPIFYKRQWVYFGIITLFAMLAVVALLPSKLLSLSNVAPGWRDAKQATRTWTDPLTVVCTMLIICGCHNGEGGPSFLETQFLRFQGRVSYAWYLWQLPIIYLLGNGYRTGKAMSYGSTAISLIAATFSTLYVEEPIRAVYVAWKARRAARTTSLELHIQ